MTGAQELTARQVAAIGAILANSTQEEAAAAVGITPRTLRRWSANERFAAELRRQRTRVLDQVATVLAGGAAAAARSLIQIATGEARASAARVSAAKAVIDAAQRLEEAGTIAGRLDELEQQLAAPGTRGGRGQPWQ
jgi:hypothetical protein